MKSNDKIGNIFSLTNNSNKEEYFLITDYNPDKKIYSVIQVDEKGRILENHFSGTVKEEHLKYVNWVSTYISFPKEEKKKEKPIKKKVVEDKKESSIFEDSILSSWKSMSLSYPNL